jgi:hypothetical protein
VQQDVHQATVDLAQSIIACHPDVDLVHAVAVDARNRPLGVGGHEMANKWLARASLHTPNQVVWNRTRMRIIESMLAADNHTDRIAAELELLSRVTSLFAEFGAAWLKSRGQGTKVLARFERERLDLIRAIDALPPPPVHTPSEISHAEFDEPFNRDPLRDLLRTCLVGVMPAIAHKRNGYRPVAAQLASLLEGGLVESAAPERWRVLGLTESPPVLREFASTLQHLAAVTAELAFGNADEHRLEAATRTVGRHRVIESAARAARSWADQRITDAVRQIISGMDPGTCVAEVLMREKSDPGVTWPPTDLLFLVEVHRLDAWPHAMESLQAQRERQSDVLDDTFSVTAIPVRSGVVIPPLGVTVRSTSSQWLPDAAAGWDLSSRQIVKDGLHSAFRRFLDSATALSSIAALPAPPRKGLEADTVLNLQSSMEASLAGLTAAAHEHDEPLLREAAEFTTVLADYVRHELAATDDSRGELARWGLDVMDDVPSELTQRVLGISYLLIEWDIAPDVASKWYADLSA